MARTNPTTESRRQSATEQSASLAPVLLAAVYPLDVFKAITGLNNWALRSTTQRPASQESRPASFRAGQRLDSYLATGESGTGR